jgi:hypothetical protein
MALSSWSIAIARCIFRSSAVTPWFATANYRLSCHCFSTGGFTCNRPAGRSAPPDAVREGRAARCRPPPGTSEAGDAGSVPARNREGWQPLKSGLTLGCAYCVKPTHFFTHWLGNLQPGFHKSARCSG